MLTEMDQNFEKTNIQTTIGETDNGEKSKNCNQCDESALRSHLKIHSGVKSNKCNVCDFASIQRGTLIIKPLRQAI